MGTETIESWFNSNVPETILMIGGILALLIVIMYLKGKESLKYKFLVLLGLIFGVIMASEAVVFYGQWELVTSVIVSIAAFTLIIRPFRDVHVAALMSLFVMVIIYLAMGDLNGAMLFDSIDLTPLSEGWPRFVVAFIIGSMVYMIANFAEAIVMLFGKLFNCWPMLGLLGLVCIVEAIFMFMGYGSIMDYIDTSAIESSIDNL